METRQSFALVRQAFRDGSVADGVILSFAKAAASRPLGSRDVASLERALEFLVQAKLGFDWIQRPQVNEQSKACAASFEVAVRTWQAAGSSGAFAADVDAMAGTVRAMLEKPTHPSVPPDALERVRVFFRGILRESLLQLDHQLTPVEESREVEWTSRSKFAM